MNSHEAARPVLHTLNAVRVLAEYCIVSYHVFFGHPASVPANYDSSELLSSHGVSVDLMSLFTVLSGFVAMYSNADLCDRASRGRFLWRRFSRTYPVYAFSLALGLPHFCVAFLSRQPACINDVVGLVSQFLCLQCWLGCGFVGSNPPSWYISSMAWVWLLFPFLPLSRALPRRPWLWVVLFYALSVASNMPFAGHDTANTRQLPAIRVWEFLMGCAAAHTLDEAHRVRGLLVASALAVYAVYACLSTAYAAEWDTPHAQDNCTFWESPPDPLLVRPGSFVTPTSIVWALLFHWLATHELAQRDHAVLRVLGFDFFRSLSAYSLQLYLCHLPISDAIQALFKLCGAHMWLSKDLLVVGCYCLSYSVYVYVQPWLDRLTQPKA